MKKNTIQIKCGNVLIGGGAPISIQSMTNVDSRDEEALVKQIKQLEEAGCEIVRIAIPDFDSAATFKAVKMRVNLPLVADIHFDYKLALAAIEAGADKVRINPGNIGDIDKVKAVVLAAKNRNIPIRVGINSGSLEKEILKNTKKETLLIDEDNSEKKNNFILIIILFLALAIIVGGFIYISQRSQIPSP